MDSKQIMLQIGREYPKEGEEKIAHQIAELLQQQMLRLYQNKKQLRQIHPKMNGCVKAEFIIEKNLPEKLKVGIFKEETDFPAWIRFSNGNTKPLPDNKKDLRGFAIKIMNVPGEKILVEGEETINQDFILMNTKNFVAKDVEDFYHVLQVVTMLPLQGPVLQKIPFIFKNASIFLNGAKAKINCNHPFELNYYSTVPYRFGEETMAVKYAVFPSKDNDLTCVQDSCDPDYLRLKMQETLSKNEIIYDFCVQFQTDAEKMPIEDPTVEWDSPFEKVATIRIPTQIFDTPEQREFGEDLSFNVWHSLPEHRPIGNFNRSRKIIYEKMSAFRHQKNMIPTTEPTAGDDFLMTQI
ncbi:MAG: catalase family protein [Bacteroidota bacterium]|nr:catalase family protein [Bacteroidota bacterium]